jgi:hypothetical protein
MKYSTIEMAFNLLYPRVDWTYQLQATGIAADISGTPGLVVGPADEVYFAFSSRGTVGNLPSVGTYQIVVGCVNSTGVVQWIRRFPQLVSNSVDSQPGLALGNTGELYITFVTIGALPGKVNGLNAPSFCGGCGASQGPEDIVVARINGAVAGIPSVAWVVQDLSINSCSVETRPRILYDSFLNRLLLTYTSSGAIICQVKVGSLNVVVNCLDPISGGNVWVFQSNLVNSGGFNQDPSVAVDSAGGVYIAYTTTNQVIGGAVVPPGAQNVEVIKITASGSPLVINRNWILSSINNVNPVGGTINSNPTIAFDTINNRLFLAWITTGIVPGGSNPYLPNPSIVFASINGTTGILNWLKQSPVYNEGSYRYSSISLPIFTLDVNGVPYVAASAVQDITGEGMIFMYRLDPLNGNSGWIYFQSSIAVRAYLPAIDSADTPNTAFRVGANYSGPWISVRSGNLYVAFVNQDTETFQLVGLRQVQRYQDITAFDYMNNFTGICG